MGALQPLHLVVILAIVLVMFGAGRLTEVGGALGKGVRDFRKNVEDPRTGGGSATDAVGFCQSCGARLSETSAKYCQQCGAAVPR